MTVLELAEELDKLAFYEDRKIKVRTYVSTPDGDDSVDTWIEDIDIKEVTVTENAIIIELK